MPSEPRCPACGYTEKDQKVHWDHRLCPNDGNAPWQQERRTNFAMGRRAYDRENRDFRVAAHRREREANDGKER